MSEAGPDNRPARIPCCVGIMAYNEEANIGRLLKALLAQKTHAVVIQEILIVCSGCTDRTEEIVRSFAALDRRVKLLSQARREGKASAVNLLLRNTDAEVIVLESADTIPVEGAIEALVAPMLDPEVGMVGGRPVPTNSKEHFVGYGIHLLWEFHHQISLRYPKMGELIAFRNVFRQIPQDSAVDEASIEPLIIGQGLKLRYAPEAIVYNKGPETVRDFFIQRRRIFAGHLYVRDTLGYKVSTMNGFRLISLFLKNLKWNKRYFLWGTGIGLLEVLVRLLATYDYVVRKRKPYVWSVAESTKDLAEVS